MGADYAGNHHLVAVVAQLLPQALVHPNAFRIDLANGVGVVQSRTSRPLLVGAKRRRADLHRDIVPAANVHVLPINRLQRRESCSVEDQPRDFKIGIDGDVRLKPNTSFDGGIGDEKG